MHIESDGIQKPHTAVQELSLSPHTLKLHLVVVVDLKRGNSIVSIP